MRRKAFNLRSWFIPRERRKMTRILCRLSAQFCLVTGCGCIGVGGSIGNGNFKVSVNTDCVQTGLDRQPGLSQESRQAISRGQNILCYLGKADPSSVSLGCHCTELRNDLCGLNKLLQHCTTDRRGTPLCDILRIPPSNGYQDLAHKHLFVLCGSPGYLCSS